MDHVNHEVASLVEAAIDAQLQFNIAWAKAAQANEKAGGRWQVTVRCLQAAGVSTEEFRLVAGVSPSTLGRWRDGLVTVARRLRPPVFEALLGAVWQDRANLVRDHTSKMMHYKDLERQMTQKATDQTAENLKRDLGPYPVTQSRLLD
ncbi:MAG: hypothetical protein Q7R71_02080 [bacterium]|nr:hypothetical protein [bacterium]